MFALGLAVACLISYWVVVSVVHPFVDHTNELLAGMWASCAAVFVFRDTRDQSWHAGMARFFATCISFPLCLIYLLIWPFHPVGIAAIVGVGTLLVILLDRRDDVITVNITTCVVMVVAAMSPPDKAWMEPILRFLDTVIGIAIALLCAWIINVLLPRTQGE